MHLPSKKKVSWLVVHATCSHKALIFAVMQLYFFKFFYCLSIPYLCCLFSLVLMNRRNGPWYQRVLALCAFLTGTILKGLVLQTFCVWCLCMFWFMSICLGTDFVVFGEFVVWWLVCRVNRRRIEVCFSPDVIRFGWLGSKYQLTNNPL